MKALATPRCLPLVAVLLTGCSTPADPTSASIGQGLCELGLPLTNLECDMLEAMGTVNVRCPMPSSGGLDAGSTGIYASPDDDCDDTEAVRLALSRAKSQKTVFLPPGSIPGHRYLLSDTIVLDGHSLRGERNGLIGTVVRLFEGTALHAEPNCHTLLQSSGGSQLADPWAQCRTGAVFAVTGANTRLEALEIDAGATGNASVEGADYGLYVHAAPAGKLRVSVKHARQVGCLIEESNHSVGCSAEQNHGDGQWFVHSDGAIASGARNNARHGVVVTNRVGSSSGGGVVARGVFECNGHGAPGCCGCPNPDPEKCPPHCPESAGNGVQTSGYGLYVLGTHAPLTVSDSWFEGNVSGGLRVEAAEHVTVATNRFVGTTLALSSCRHCIVSGNVVAGGTPETDDVFIEGTNTKYIYVSNNIYSGGTGPRDARGGNGTDPFEVVWTTASGVFRFAQDEVRLLNAAAASHTDPLWRVGDVVWNREPQSTASAGSVCKHGNEHACQYADGSSAWAPFGSLQ